MLSRVTLGVLTCLLVGSSALGAQSTNIEFGDQFLGAVFLICPQAVRSDGAALADSEWLNSLGFFPTDTKKPISSTRSKSLEIFYNRADKYCSVTPIEEEANATVEFVTEWTKQAKWFHKDVDLPRELKQPYWTPLPVRVADDNWKSDMILVFGHASASKLISETYTLIVLAP